MRRTGLLGFAISMVFALACNDVTGPPAAKVRQVHAPQPSLTIPSISAQVSAGYFHTCALKTDGTVVCWGENSYGQGTTPDGLVSIAQIGAGGDHNCALRTDGTVACWGSDLSGQSTVPPALTSVAQISVGTNHSCALKTDATLVCWGSNDAGQTDVPAGLPPVTQVSAGYAHTCAVVSDGTVACWGLNAYGQATVPAGLASVVKVSSATYHTCALRADGTVVCWGISYSDPTVPDGIAPVAQLSSAGAHNCVIGTDAGLTCWGQNNFGETTKPEGLGSVTLVSAGAAHTCALKADGTVSCWGYDGYGQSTVPAGLNLIVDVAQSIAFTSAPPSPALTGEKYAVTATGGGSGNPVTFSSLSPGICSVSGASVSLDAIGDCVVAADQAAAPGYKAATQVTQTFTVTAAPPLTIPAPFAQVSAGGYHTCAQSVTGLMKCWGDNDYGQLNVPSGAAAVSEAGAGYFHTCSLTTDGVVHCGLGDGTLGQVPSMSEVAQFDAGEQYVMCALQTNRTVVCWGNNGGGNATVPAGLSNVEEVAVGHNHACARKIGGSVVCWGLNTEGQATPPIDLSSVIQLTAGGSHSCALKANATVTCWGSNTFGQSTVPAELGAIAQVSAGYEHSCAVRADATLVCWGNSANGRTAVPTNLPPVTRVSAGRYHTCAVTTAGNVVCWGDNGFGQSTVPAGLNVLGIQSISFTSTPPIPSLTGGSYSVAATGGASGNAVTFSSLTNSVCTVTAGNVSLLTVGNCTIAADQAAGNGYNAAGQVVQTFAVSSSSQVLAFTSSPPNPGLVGASYSVSATGGASGNPVIFGSVTPSICTVAGSSVAFTQIGNCIVTANQAGGGGYTAATQISQSITVMGTQTILISSTPPNPALTGTSYMIAATGGASGSPLVFTSRTADVCTVGGRSIKLIAPGSCTVAGNQAAGNGYLAAAEVTQTFNVYVPQTIKFTSNPPNKPMIGGTYVLTASGGASGNPVTFSTTTPSLCSVSGNTTLFLASGTCIIAANQGGTATYAAAAQVTQNVKIK